MMRAMAAAVVLGAAAADALTYSGCECTLTGGGVEGERRAPGGDGSGVCAKTGCDTRDAGAELSAEQAVLLALGGGSGVTQRMRAAEQRSTPNGTQVTFIAEGDAHFRPAGDAAAGRRAQRGRGRIPAGAYAAKVKANAAAAKAAVADLSRSAKAALGRRSELWGLRGDAAVHGAVALFAFGMYLCALMPADYDGC